MSKAAYRSTFRVTLATAFILLVPLVAMQITDEANWNLADFAFAGALLGRTGPLLELAARKPGNIAYRAAAAAIGVAATALGEADDAPGLVLFGCLLIVATVALTIRTARRSAWHLRQRKVRRLSDRALSAPSVSCVKGVRRRSGDRRRVRAQAACSASLEAKRRP
jgi:hypothetical protein